APFSGSYARKLLLTSPPGHVTHVKHSGGANTRAGVAVLAVLGPWLGHFLIDSPMTASGLANTMLLVAIPTVAYVAAYRPAMKAEWQRFAAVAPPAGDHAARPWRVLAAGASGSHPAANPGRMDGAVPVRVLVQVLLVHRLGEVKMPGARGLQR